MLNTILNNKITNLFEINSFKATSCIILVTVIHTYYKNGNKTTLSVYIHTYIQLIMLTERITVYILLHT